jgi:predicted nucleic acid-binding protein
MAVGLIDANILVYAHDRGEIVKQKRAIEILDLLRRSNNGRVSTQTLAEFFSVTTRGRSPILSSDMASQQVELLAQAWPVLLITPQTVITAARGARNHRLAYYDAQLWATALLNQVPVIFSEDFDSGASLEGVRFVNPFMAEIVLKDWE